MPQETKKRQRINPKVLRKESVTLPEDNAGEVKTEETKTEETQPAGSQPEEILIQRN